jgi:hypothetical protein
MLDDGSNLGRRKKIQRTTAERAAMHCERPACQTYGRLTLAEIYFQYSN